MLAISQTAKIEPEDCILNALKSGAKQENAGFIRFNCVRKYIRSVESNAVSVSLKYFVESKIEWFPETPALPDPIPEKIIVRLKNNSMDRVISADVVLAAKNSNKRPVYRAYADYPIDPGTVGTLTANVLASTSDKQSPNNFWDNHIWALKAVYGVVARH